MNVRTLTMLLVSFVCLCLDMSLAFNVDVRSPVIHNGLAGTEFGFSVELHKEQNTNWLLVGAPRAQTIQPGVDEGGAVYKCPVTPYDNPGVCQEIPFDTTGNPTTGSTQTGSKSNQRFGYTVKSSGPNGPVVACAPLRMWYTDEGRYRFPVGGCFVARNDFNDFTEMKPCETEDNTQWKRIGPVYCQAGMSAVINENVLVMGGPGSIYWQGGLYVDYFTTQKLDPRPFQDSQSLDDSYRGYSVTFGEFTGDTNPDLAVGLPRAPDHKGQVRLYSTDLIAIASSSSMTELNGEQVGSYFGHSLTAIDINADGLDDLIIGAPMYIDEDKSTEGWEAGRVYIYFQDESHNFGVTVEKLTGTRKRARFGFSVAAIGDMDKDGFNDFAVGAPYDGDDGMGAVYIYHGKRKGLRINPAQVVYPSVFDVNIDTFGYSLASGLDMDNNAYIDLLVGAYNSSTAVLLRARPVIHVTVDYTIHPEAIDLDVKDKQLPDGSLVADFMITTCFTYTGQDVPMNLELAFTMTLDSQRPLSSRAVFTSNDYKLSNQIRLERDTRDCLVGDAYVKNNIRDKQTPIGILVNYSLAINESSMQPGQIAPILNQNADAFAYKAVPLINQCKNFHCLPDLQLEASTTTSELVIGGGDPIFLDVMVTNDGEDAFEAVFIAHFPVGLQFVRVERKQSDVSVTCNEDTDNNILVCDLGNPFPESHQVSFGIKLDNIGLLGDDHQANITMEVKSASQELANTTADNFANITVDVRVEAQITFTGVSDPPIYEIPAEDENKNGDEEMEKEIKTEADAGPQVTHYYMLRNLGPSNIGPTSIEIKWPMKLSDDQYLLYLISATMGFTGEPCEITDGGQVNPEGLTPEPEIARTNDTAGQTAALKAALQNGDRNRRQADSQPLEPAALEDIDCKLSPKSCYTIRCVTNGLMAGNDQLDSVTIILKSRLWLDTVSQLNVPELSISSSAEAQVQSMPYAIAPTQLPADFEQVTTLVVPEKLTPIPAKAIPLWVYVVATMVGVFILSVIVLGLWKIGFFKRKKIQPNTTMVSDDTWVEDVLQPKK